MVVLVPAAISKFGLPLITNVKLLAKVALAVTASVAPSNILICLLLLPRLLPLVMDNAPSLIFRSPINVFVPVSTKVPAPVLVISPRRPLFWIILAASVELVSCASVR